MRLVGIFLFGALIGSIFDGFHTHSGATAYPSPWLLGMAWWTPLLFGAAALAIARSHVQLDRRLRRRARPLRPARVALGLCAFGLAYYESGFLAASNQAKLALLLGAWLALWALLDRSWQGAVQALLTAAAGFAVELTLTRLGAFAHLRPDVLGLPCWLPALYMLASLAVGDLGRWALGAPAPRLDPARPVPISL